MRGGRDGYAGRILDRAREVGSDCLHVVDVVGADDHQGRATDFAESFVDRGIECRRLLRTVVPCCRLQLVGTQHHLPDQLPRTWVESAPGEACPMDPELKAR